MPLLKGSATSSCSAAMWAFDADMAQAALTHLLSFFGLVRLKTVLADLRKRGSSG